MSVVSSGLQGAESRTLSTDDRTVTMVDLESRAGASDTDRPAWLAERHGGCTATEARDLHTGAKTTAKIAALKLGWEPEKDLAFVPRIKWGKDREPHIVAAVAGLGFVPESRVFHAADNSRYLVSPDGFRVDFDGNVIALLEVKTYEGAEPLTVDSEHFEKLGYAWQGYWAMRVTGVRKVTFAIEPCVHLGGGEYAVAGPVYTFDLHWDDEKIAELQETVDTFLVALDDLRENGLDPIAISLLEDAIATSAAQKAARDALEAYCASSGLSSLRIPEGSMSYSTPAPRQAFQQTAFREAHPAMFEEFVQAVPAAKPTLRITPARSKETKK